jgi:hypothetical protein
MIKGRDKMTKPKSMRMKVNEANYAPEYVQAYPADEMDEYIDTLKAENDRLKNGLDEAINDWKEQTETAVALAKENECLKTTHVAALKADNARWKIRENTMLI